MTEDYIRDMHALKELIKAIDSVDPSTLPSDDQTLLGRLRILIEQIRLKAIAVDSSVSAASQAFEAIESLRDADQGGFSSAMRQKLNGLMATGQGGDLRLLEQIFLLIEDGNTGNNHSADFVEALRVSMGWGNPTLGSRASDLGKSAQAAGAEIESFMTLANTPDFPTMPTPLLLASALDALIPVAEAGGIPTQVRDRLHALRKTIPGAGGGGPGTGYWPSNYVYSSSSSGGSSSSSSPGI